MTKKYFKPKSVTWLSSAAPLMAGLFIALEPVHGLSPWVEAVRSASGMTAPALINIGLAGIGLRGAIGD